ncbi:hypothetical protein HN51_036253 [Arachis hypogaea]|uniref:Uncharacterized protein n=1 Tax=Arachis hypogaea TaxID=3818 RepID=A0A445A0S3_ARAHY|nr:splicing factor, arginine/serine-rich 15 [Arachis hypogaea]XP_057746999.1 uncharacterized protein LOC130966232 [Arachis stenosperma]QHO01568.1 uncharacterized protein DS421_13g416270 [Arachis hypogaea]QHO57687.1 uncharacterized protein DS421_3g84390 [Arachis hypogaea]RYR20026.1 hypothetical protein Ahy_B03g065107 [Arachis hypogaea]RYR67191.1 hypothetical protein Ahy_A03g013498 [Arachis hypogaea]
MAFRKVLMLLFCLVAIVTNLVSSTSARQLNDNNAAKDEKGANEGDHEVVNNNHVGNKETKPPMMGLGDQKQIDFPPIFPFPSFSFPPFPMPQIPSFGGIPGIPFPSLPVPAMPFPTFPPLDIPGIVPTPPT